MKRRLIIFSESRLKPVISTVESNLVRYLASEIIGVIDEANAGKTVQQVLGFGGEIPITATLDELLPLKPNCLLIGSYPYKSSFPMEWYPMVIKAIQMGMNILNGLLQPLNSIAEFDLLAEKYKAKLVNFRLNQEKPVRFKGTNTAFKTKKIFVAGANSQSGKLVSTIEIVHAMHKKGISADWIPSGLSSNLIKGKGLLAESVNADLVSGYIEGELHELADKFEYVFVEGQGFFADPIKGGIMLSLLHGARPDGIILCYRPETEHDTNNARKVLDFHKQLFKKICPAPIIGFSLNTGLFASNIVQKIINNLEQSLDLPVFDPLRSDLDRVVADLHNLSKN